VVLIVVVRKVASRLLAVAGTTLSACMFVCVCMYVCMYIYLHSRAKCVQSLSVRVTSMMYVGFEFEKSSTVRVWKLSVLRGLSVGLGQTKSDRRFGLVFHVRGKHLSELLFLN
jgi:hypothetical protein